MERANAEDICTLLDKLNISYQRISHGPAMTMDDLISAEAILGAPFSKNLFLRNRQKTQQYLLMMEGGKRFRAAELSREIACDKLSFGDSSQLYQLLGANPGAISPLGLAFDTTHQVKLLIDNDLLLRPRLCVHPCVNTQSVCLSTEDLLHKYLVFSQHTPQFVTLV